MLDYVNAAIYYVHLGFYIAYGIGFVFLHEQFLVVMGQSPAALRAGFGGTGWPLFEFAHLVEGSFGFAIALGMLNASRRRSTTWWFVALCDVLTLNMIFKALAMYGGTVFPEGPARVAGNTFANASKDAVVSGSVMLGLALVGLLTCGAGGSGAKKIVVMDEKKNK